MLPADVWHFITTLVAFFWTVGWWRLFKSGLQSLLPLEAFLCDVYIVHQCIVSLCEHQTMTNGSPSLMAA